MCSQQDWHKTFTHQISFSLRKSYCKSTIHQSQEQNTKSSVNSCKAGKARKRNRINTDTVLVTSGEGRYKRKNEGGGRIQRESAQKVGRQTK